MGAYLHGPITLSPWSWGLLVEYPQDHSTFDALDEQGGGEIDGVVDGDIYYYATFFLSWIPKHEKKDLLAAHSSFLFMEACQTTMEDSFMDPYIILLLTYGKKYGFTFADLYTLTIILQCMALQVGKIFRLLHGLCCAKLYDGGRHLSHGLW